MLYADLKVCHTAAVQMLLVSCCCSGLSHALCHLKSFSHCCCRTVAQLQEQARSFPAMQQAVLVVAAIQVLTTLPVTCSRLIPLASLLLLAHLPVSLHALLSHLLPVTTAPGACAEVLLHYQQKACKTRVVTTLPVTCSCTIPLVSLLLLAHLLVSLYALLSYIILVARAPG